MIIGLTGGIASGKTAVSDILERKNAYIIDTDAVYREISGAGSECDLRLREAFPECCQDGAMDRARLKQAVFSSPERRLLLNSVTHPLILAEVKLRLNGRNVAIVVIPLLFESGFDKMCDKTVCVIAPAEERLRRAMARDGITRELAQKIMAAQMNDAELMKKCDYVIYNDGDLERLEKNVLSWWDSIKA